MTQHGRTDEPSLQVLSNDECWTLLASQQVGRLAVVAGHYPLVVPVNYALDRRILVVRTGEGTLLQAASHANVAFQVDQVDPIARAGWSVLVRGLAEEVTDRHREELVESTHATGATPWAPGDRGHWLRVIPHDVTGRRIVPGELPPPFLDAGYL
jgi:nitroimidazol reductase NimA-like FMN-containing flavoprotein (pyridoxamine 5'-phosphate oxidase superfamily)